MPRRSAPALWDQPLVAVNTTAKAKAHLMFLARSAGKMNLVTLSLDTVILNQLGAFGLTAQRNAQSPRPGIHRRILHPGLIDDRVERCHGEPLHHVLVFV